MSVFATCGLVAIFSRSSLPARAETIATKLSQRFNASLYIGVAGPGLGAAASVADGDRDRAKPGKQQARPSDLIPGGSITKAHTPPS
jgi:hypothetical protein